MEDSAAPALAAFTAATEDVESLTAEIATAEARLGAAKEACKVAAFQIALDALAEDVAEKAER